MNGVNNGQTCFLGTRVLAPSSRYDEVVDAFAAFADEVGLGTTADRVLAALTVTT